MIRTTTMADRAVRMLALSRQEGGPRLIAAALMLLPLGACGGTDGARSTVTTRDTARRLLEEQPYPPALPAYNAVLATADGGVWVRDFRMPAAEPTPERWTIFDSEGRSVAVVELPPGFTPMYVEKRVVLGVHRDSLDVPSVDGYTVG